MNLIERIDEARTRWNVLDHPFYLRWERGELSREDLAYYAGEYRHAVVALADAAAVGGDAEHAAEEAAHIDLWDDFAAALDAPLDREPNIETRECTTTWRPEDSLEARAVLYAVESGQPAISRTKLTGLVDHYGFTAGSKATEYFELHGRGASERGPRRRRPPSSRRRSSARGQLATTRRRSIPDGLNARMPALPAFADAAPRVWSSRPKSSWLAKRAGLRSEGMPALPAFADAATRQGRTDRSHHGSRSEPDFGRESGVRARGLEPLRSQGSTGT